MEWICKKKPVFLRQSAPPSDWLSLLAQLVSEREICLESWWKSSVQSRDLAWGVFCHPYALQTHSASQILCRRLRFAMNASLFESVVCLFVFEFMLGRTFSELCDLMAHNISVPVSVIDINDWFIGINYLFIWLWLSYDYFMIINPFYFI